MPFLYLLLLLTVLIGLVTLKKPSHHRHWKPDMARLARVERSGDALTIHNVRNNRYGAPGTPFETHWETRHYDLSRAKRVWFVLESFSALEVVAHTLISFEFEEGVFLAFSAEARLEEGEKYGIVSGLLNQFELAYTYGDERDLILRRTTYQDHDVYLYPLDFSPRETRALLEDIVQKTDALYQKPAFYNSVWRNCTGLLGFHANHVRPKSFAWWQPVQVMPGLSDRLLDRKGWIEGEEPFEALRQSHNIKRAAQNLGDDPQLSLNLRKGMRGA